MSAEGWGGEDRKRGGLGDPKRGGYVAGRPAASDNAASFGELLAKG